MRFVVMALALVVAAGARGEDEKIFSGPQPGEKLTGFKVLGVYDDLAGKEMDFVAEAKGKPTLLVFVHELTRPSMAFVKAVTAYAESRSKDGVKTYIVWLDADRSNAEAFLKRARGSLNFKVPVGISPDGAEGPGAYGLNRKVTLTVIVANENKVKANFALVQPSVTETPEVAEALVKVAGGKAPTLAQLEALAFPGRAGGRRVLGMVRRLLAKEATDEEVKKTAAGIEKLVGTNKGLQRQLAQAAARALRGEAGTPAARAQLKKWVDAYGPKKTDK